MMFLRSTDQADHPRPETGNPDRMGLGYLCLVAVVAVLAGVVIALIGG